ncbi:hypothetical protein D3C75_552680 [compost metagenome]
MLLADILREVLRPHTRGQRLEGIFRKIERQVAHSYLYLRWSSTVTPLGGVNVNLLISTEPFC